MHVPLDLVPSTRLNSENFTQSPDSVVDLLGFDELAIMLTVTARTLVSASSIDVLLETAMENRDDRYFTLRELASLTSDSTDRYQKLVNLQGMGVADSDSASTTNKGFGRHVRVRVTGMGEGDIINFDVKAIARQHGGARMTPMSLDLVPHVRVSDDTYTQPLDSIVDLLGYNDVQMHLNVSGTGISPGTVPIYVATAMENRDDRYLRVYELVDLDNDMGADLKLTVQREA